MFCNRPQNTVSLEDMANDFYEQNEVRITKQAIQERFNNQAANFMDSLLKHQLSRQLPVLREREAYQYFKRVRVKDSTRFSLPKEFASLYKGHGGVSGPAQISIQYEYDLLTNEAILLDLTSACRNDQQDSKETLNDIEPEDLLIRDLGYVSLAYIQHIGEHKAYYLNRLNPRSTVYDTKQNPIDFTDILNNIRKYSLTTVELEIFFKTGNKWIPSRLVISPVDEKTYRKRIEKAKERTQRGYQISERYKVLAALNLFITNIPVEWLTAQQVIQTYRLRWQIELVFKVWKSQVHISQLKPTKVQRFQCELIARFLWVLLHWQALRLTQQLMHVKCSIWKFYKVAHQLSSLLKQVVFNHQSFAHWWNALTNEPDKRYHTETKKNKSNTLYAINLLLT